MKNNTSSRDFKQLSAYLDGQLTPVARARLENRLREEPALRSSLDELRNTRRMLRSLPKARVPRNFTLSPHMAVQKPSQRVFPAMGFVSALASILLVVVVVSDWLGGATLKIASRPAEALQVVATVQVESKVSAEETVVEEEAPMLVLEAAPAESQADESQPVEVPEAEAPLMYAAPPGDNTVTLGEGMTGTVDVAMKALEIPPAGEEEMILPSSTTTVTESPSETPTMERQAELTETPAISIEAARSPEEDLTSNAQPNAEAEGTLHPRSEPLIWLRILEGILLFTAFAAGITAVVQRRKRIH
jgi:anti-sigma factor RsiW